MISEDAARRFATAWYDAWNSHNLDRIMERYADSIEHSSPFIARYNADPTNAPLRGKPAVRAYFGRALERNPTLRFDPLHIAVGVDTVALVYRRMTGELAVETFHLDHRGLITRSTSHYGVPSRRKATVEGYFQAFRESHHEAILALLTNDVVWDLPGYKRLKGKAEFDSEIENENFVGSPKLILDRLVEEGDTVVAIGTGEGQLRDGQKFRFAYSTVLTFAGDLVKRVESYVVPLK